LLVSVEGDVREEQGISQTLKGREEQNEESTKKAKVGAAAKRQELISNYWYFAC
jgi:hypothetical protein